MQASTTSAVCRGLLSAAVALLVPLAVRALPASGPLVFDGPTPSENAIVTSTSVGVRISAKCTVDDESLAVSLNGTPIPAANFLPFSACTNGRKLSQVATVNLTLPNSTITGGPTNLTAGQAASYTGSASNGGDTLNWNFHGAAPPATGASVNRTFEPAGDFTFRLQATTALGLDASALDNANLVTAERDFRAGDPTPATRQVKIAMPADVDFRNFETAQTHPLVLSSAGDELYAVNTVEGRLAIFDVAGDGSLSFAGDVAVGLDPVSAAPRPGSNEVWVVNHLSDSVSVVNVATRTIVDTIAVGDEPTDVAFASGRAFVTLAGNQDRVKVYSASTRSLVATLDIFGDDPRALAVNAAGTEVYAVVLESGNQSTILFPSLVEDGGGPPPEDPPRLPGLGTAPEAGLIVQRDPATGDWEDEDGNDWSEYIDYNLPDYDVFVIDADAATPSVIRRLPRVGTSLFDVAVQPGTGDLWVPNTDARNLVRFEPKLRGHLVETRITVVDPVTGVDPPVIDLNSHINYNLTPGPPAEIAASLAHPVTGIFNASGSTYYVAGMGSRKVGVVDAGTGSVDELIAVGDGPSGLALNEADNRLYVLNRFDNTISTVNTTTNAEVDKIGVAGPSRFDPSPDVIKVGRKFLYDGELSSGHGDTACASCHIFGNFDNIAWELGSPQGSFVDYDNAPWVTFAPLGPSTDGFDPQKGPMTTQSLRGLEGMEPFHWRGDRQNFQHFNEAFIALMGRSAQIDPADMDTFTDFIMTVKYPPNPFRNLDNSMPTAIQVPNQTGGGALVNGNPNSGQTAFTVPNLDGGVFTCNVCHLLPTGTTNNLFNGQLEGETQDFKIPHLRNMYEKVGFDVIRPQLLSGNGNNIGLTDQKRGFGFIHDGAVSLTEFLAANVFQSTTQQERDLFAFMLAFPTETRPAVGRQQFVTAANKSVTAVTTTINTLISQAEALGCDLIVKGTVGGVTRGYVYDTASNMFLSDSLGEGPQNEATLRNTVQAAGDHLVYMGVPPGAGVRMGIDRDRDTWLDRSEVALGFDPADPTSNPWQ